MQLGSSARSAGFALQVFPALGSTNDEALAQARSGAGGRRWVVAREQTAGRGRHGRLWRSPPGNLYASLLLIDPCPVERGPEIGFVAGVALASALRALLGGDQRLQLKWPNDALYGEAKLSGLLLEAAKLEDERFACVVGFGVNCGDSPKDLPYPATCLREIGTMLFDPADVLAALSDAMAHWLAVWDGGWHFADVRKAWLALARGIGAPVKVIQGERELTGVFQTIDARGRMLLQGPGGRLDVIEAGDVLLQPRGIGATL